MRSCLITVAAVLWITALGSSNAHAYGCGEPKPPPCEAYWQASAVFIGRVTSLASIPVKEDGYDTHQNQVHFLVEKIFRGIDSPEVDLFIAATSCAYGFTKGETYLVYAYRNEKANQLSTSNCSRTQPAAQAVEDLQYLMGLASASASARIYGDVMKYKRDAEGTLSDQPIPRIKVTATRADKHYETMTDDKGEFSIAGLPEGSYKLSVDLPAGLTAAYGTEHEIKVVERGCAMVKVFVEIDGRLSGKALDFKGQPMANAALGLVPINQSQNAHGGMAYSNEAGLFEFKRVPPGRYALVIRFDGQLTSQKRPFPLMYYPGVSDINQATVINIGEGERVENYDLRMPMPLKERTIKGLLTWADGRPATDVSFGYQVGEQLGYLYAVTVDAQGRFAFSVYEGIDIFLRANYEKGKGNYLYSPPVKVSTTTGDEIIKVVIPDK